VPFSSMVIVATRPSDGGLILFAGMLADAYLRAG
jgi:hypothetical protein